MLDTTAPNPAYFHPIPVNDESQFLHNTDPSNQSKPVKSKFLLGILVIFLITGCGYVLNNILNLNLLPSKQVENTPTPQTTSEPQSIGEENKNKVKTFSSEEEFIKYLDENKADSQINFGLGSIAQDTAVLQESMSKDSTAINAPAVDGALPDRMSQTNVQVIGIDEPDIVKTNGQQIFYSSNFFQDRIILRESIAPDSAPLIYPLPQNQNGTKIIQAFPPTDLKQVQQLEKNGNLLLNDNVLIIQSDDLKIYGFDISKPEAPEQKWEMALDDNYIVSSRLYQKTLYLVTQAAINKSEPCPIKPLKLNTTEMIIECNDIYHPVTGVPIDTTFSIFKINPTTGEVLKKTAFTGSSGQSVIYMSPLAIYLTYTYRGDYIDFMYRFFLEKANDLIPQSITDKLNKLKTYDISTQAKMMELQTIMAEMEQSLGGDEKLKMDNEITNRMEDFLKTHSRELSKTGIAKFGFESLDLLATGEIPGHPLNQFSLDEYENNLRCATTTSDFWGLGINMPSSTNDVYILDANLKLTGSVTDMGLTERIYSARFIGTLGYIVTFRQTDPFYVLDLANPFEPKLKGELKIPGFSSYLHPLEKDMILGVGQENSQVKLSFFDVSNPEIPIEVDKYLLDDYWSEVQTSHHAFLQDPKHQIFFVPGSRGGYIFSYAGNKLELKSAISDIQAKRALFLNDYLYIIGENKIVVISEIDWQKLKELEF